MNNRYLKTTALLAVGLSLTFAYGPPALAEPFSFYGVRFGMTQEQIGEKWLPLSEGTYAVQSSSIRNIEPLFDHEGKLYEFSFTVDLEMEEPPMLVNRAFQTLVESKWGRQSPGVDFSIVAGRNSSTVTLTNLNLKKAYIISIVEKIEPLLKP